MQFLITCNGQSWHRASYSAALELACKLAREHGRKATVWTHEGDGDYGSPIVIE